MIGAEREHKVTVWSTSHTVTVYQKSKSVWVAVGDYMGERIDPANERRKSALGRATHPRRTAQARV
jgi:hypothetical protein